MATTVSKLLVGPNSASSIRGRLQDIDDTAYSDNLLMNYISDAQQDFALTGCCQHSADVTPDGSNSYISLNTTTLTYQHMSIYAVTHNNLPLDFAPMSEARYWSPSSGTPTAWTIWMVSGEDRMYFDTIPTITYAVTIWFTFIPVVLTSTSDTLIVPDKWHTALKAYTEYRVRSMDREDGLADRAFAEYQGLRQAAARVYEGLLTTGGPSK